MSEPAPSSPTVVLLAAPPIGIAAWEEVTRRLQHHGLDVLTPDLFDPVHAGHILEGGSQALLDALAPTVEGACLVSHGLANPLALHLAARVPIAQLVLANGPIDALDPVTTSLVRMAGPVGPLPRQWARPQVARPVLASSAALRRLVVNPYVMDRDMVVRVTESWTADRVRRKAFARWLRDLPALVRSAPPPPRDTVLAWGDEDALYPAHIADSATGTSPDIVHFRIPGGRNLHPIERPWELADAVAERLRAHA